MSHLDRAIRRQILLVAGIFAVMLTVVAYLRLHELATFSATSAAPTSTATAQAPAEPNLPTVVVTARRDPAVREVTDDPRYSGSRLVMHGLPNNP